MMQLRCLTSSRICKYELHMKLKYELSLEKAKELIALISYVGSASVWLSKSCRMSFQVSSQTFHQQHFPKRVGLFPSSLWNNFCVRGQVLQAFAVFWTQYKYSLEL